MERSEILKRIRNGISNQDPKAEIYLYGSRARGDNRKDSDWDILVISPNDKITFDYESELRDPIVDIELDSGEIVSILVYSKKDWMGKQSFSPLFLNVSKEGIRI
ncbi:MAG: nucleotidyltransferase domain-containing protein [Bacteroidota bacterium]|nr:nucleotidyltransferase domain-containing protein [Bacteroidota bacterium]